MQVKKLVHTRPKIPHEIQIMVVAAFVIALGYGIVAPVIPQFATSFGVGVAVAGLVISVFAGTRFIFAPVAGVLIDSLGARKMYLLGLITVAISTGLCGFAQEYWQLVALRGLAGFGSTTFTVSAMGLIVRLSPPEIRGHTSSVYATGFVFGNILGPLLGAVLSVLGLRWPFFIYAMMVALAALLVWWRMPRTIGVRLDKNTELPVMSFNYALKSRAYRAALLSNFINGWVNFGVRIATVPLFVAAVFTHGSAVVGFAMTAFAAGNALALLFSGDAADRYGRKPLAVSGLFMCGIFTALVGFTSQIIPLLVISGLAGFGTGLYNPAVQAVVADVIGNKRSGGKVLANYQMVSDLGTIVGPIFIGVVAQTLGFDKAFVMCGGLFLLAALLWLFAEETLLRLMQQHML
ncbi:arabinose efflux permease family protein [Corynebacterium kutscheri]|uniref:Arabinose efflux permease family protein n=2 Tax=Corynebacterium kutscheri TaxID=35755 RepID=A0A0F6TDY9_9CORY|nr:arabinose efflux permease family protein [Corynebacterium kutscheri]VEH10011.1 multidrug resistance protein [Corynebacterium kutscheri]